LFVGLFILVVSALCYALSDSEITFLRDTERDTICTNIGFACHGGCPGVKCTEDNEHLLEIRWPADNVTGILSSFANLTYLQVFDVSDNIIESLPESIVFPPALKEVSFAGNLLTKLPSLSLESISSFDISHNQIKTLPSITARKLVSLKVSHNYLKAIPTAYGSKYLTALKNIELEDNCLDCSKLSSLFENVQYKCESKSQQRCLPSSSQSPTPASSSPGGLSPGAIAGIVCICVAAAIAVVVVAFLLRMKFCRPVQTYQSVEDPFEKSLLS